MTFNNYSDISVLYGYSVKLQYVSQLRSLPRQSGQPVMRSVPLGIVVTLGIAMLFIYGDIVMRILSKRQLKEMVLYSPQHIARLEKAGTFPKRVQIGPNRVGWVEDEVLDWLQQRLDRREDLTGTPV